MKRALLFSLFLFLSLRAQAANDLFKNYDNAAAKNQWKQAVEIALDVANHNPSARSLARLKASYALFQAGFPNSALTVLSQIPLVDWKNLPEGENHFVEIASLVQKKVPLAILPGRLEQANPQATSPLLKSEVLFARGRAALESGKLDDARNFLSQVPRQSRLYAHAHFLLGTIAVKRKDYASSEKEFSLVFEPSVLQQSTEFWRDVSAQMAQSWGGNVRIYLDTNELILENARLGELAAMGLARVSYAKQDFNGALGFYGRIPVSSRYYSRAGLERIWTLLALNRHEEAQALAGQLAIDGNRFESLEAKVLRAIVLTDVARTEEARQELDAFRGIAKTVREGIRLYESTRAEHGLPAFLQTDFSEDKRLNQLGAYQKEVRDEMDHLRREDARLFPSFARFAVSLEPLVTEARDLRGKLMHEWIEKRKQDLDRLAVQASLVEIETYLEDREKLRNEYRSLTNITEEQQREHDERLEKLLRKVVQRTDELTAKTHEQNLRLEMRQAELLWELGSAVTILSQTKKDAKLDKEADSLKNRAYQTAKAIAEKHPEFSENARALFFSGYAATEMGKEREGTTALEKFVAKYPRHDHAPDAYRILADERFDRNDFAGAENLYKKIIDFPDSPVFGYALYKIGWCAYNRKDFARALLALEKTVVWTRDVKEQSQVLSLSREARRDLISLYAEVGDYRRAYDYFSQFLKGDPREWLADLANELYKNGQYEKSSEVYKLLVSLNPNDPESVFYQASVVSGGFHLRRWNEVIDALQVIADRFAAEVVQPSKKDAHAKAQELVRQAVLAKEFEYRKAPDDTAAEHVTRLYDLYLRVFANWPESQEPRYRYAVFLKSRKKNAEAAEQFKLHWEQFGATLKDPVREEALRNYIDALKDLDKDTDRTVLMALANQYRKEYPKTKYTRAVAFLVPATLFKLQQTDEAIRESQALFDENPGDEIGKLCFKNLRVAYYDRKNWSDTYVWATGLLKRGGPAIKDYLKDLQTIQEESLFLQAQGAQNPEEAARLYSEVAKDKDSRLREKGIVNAFVSLRQAGKNAEALRIVEDAEHGGGEKLKALDSIAGARAALYQEAGDYERALPLLQMFVKEPPKDTAKDVVDEAKRNIGLLQEAFNARAGSGGEEKAVGAAEPRGWKELLRKKARVEKGLVGRKGDLGAAIESGTAAFQKIVEEFMTVARDQKVPAVYAFEAYCATPLMYRAHAQAILNVANRPEFAKEKEALVTELDKIAAPLRDKANELAETCLKQTEEGGEAGKFYEEVARGWGQEEKAAQVKIGADLARRLAAAAPWIETPEVKGSEKEILQQHYTGQMSAESWYALAFQRWHRKLPGLARLTAADALAKYPDNAPLLNLVAVSESAMGRRKEAEAAWRKAMDAGSAHASVNLAILELGAGRIGGAKKALEAGGKAFQGSADLEKMVEEFLK